MVGNLTPVRIRGKRKHRASTAPTGQKSHCFNKPPSALGRGADIKYPEAKKMKRSLSAVLADRSTRFRPSLDSLPTELLEKILLYSANLSLPRAAPHIGVKLSGRVTLLRLFIWAFHDTWDQWFGVPCRDDIFYGPTIKNPEDRVCGGDPELQSAVLELPWVNIDFILQAQQTWADTYARHRWYQHSIDWNLDEDGIPRHYHDNSHDFGGGFHHFDSRHCFEADYQRALCWQPFEPHFEPWGFRDVHPRTRVPVSLLTGPWDDEKQRRAFWLARGGAFNFGGVGYASTPPWEVRIELLRNVAINASEPNTLLYKCLVRSWVYWGLPKDIVRDEMRRIRQRVEWGGDNDTGRSILREIGTALSSFLMYDGYEA